MAQFFAVADYLVFASVLILSAAVGIYYALRDGKQSKSNADTYLIGNRKLPLIPVALSLLVSYCTNTFCFCYQYKRRIFFQ